MTVIEQSVILEQGQYSISISALRSCVGRVDGLVGHNLTPDIVATYRV